MRTLPEMLAAVTSRHGERVALVSDRGPRTYAELEGDVRAQATALARGGTAPGERVGLLLPNGEAFVTGYLAVVAAGAVAVPLNPQYRREDLQRAVTAAVVSRIVTAREHAELCREAAVPAGPGLAVVIPEERPGRAGAATLETLARTVAPDSPAMDQFSSGSTGLPKRITRTHGMLVRELDGLARALGTTAEARVLGVTPFSHVNGLVRSMLLSIRSGATLYCVPQLERRPLADLLLRERISVFVGVPFMFGMLAQMTWRGGGGLPDLRVCLSASAPLPRRISEAFHERFGVHVRQLYGSTETGTISANLDGPVPDTLESVGRPLDGVTVELLDEGGRPAAPGGAGEIGVRSPWAIRGYAGEIGGEAFRDGLFLTGDLGRTDGDGRLYLLGRRSFFINKGGHKVNPREVEMVLEAHPAVREAAVVGLPTPLGDERVKAVVVLERPTRAEELARFCQERIAAFKVPAIIEFADALPKGPTGKVVRQALGEAPRGARGRPDD